MKSKPNNLKNLKEKQQESQFSKTHFEMYVGHSVKILKREREKTASAPLNRM